MPVAFKEWAVTVRALAEGEQLLTLRKGGIREENKHFEIEHDRFFLYPTFDHQRNDLVRQSHLPELARALEEGVWPDDEPPAKALLQDGGIPQPERVRIRAWAEVSASYLITDPRAIDALSPYYVWTTDYAEKRLAWKRRHPLHVMVLRTYRIPRPVTVKVRPEYHGCRSWLELYRDLPFEGTPGALRRGVRAGLRGDRGDRLGRRSGPRLTSTQPAHARTRARILPRHATPREAGHAGACRRVRNRDRLAAPAAAQLPGLPAAPGPPRPPGRHARPALRHERRRRLLEHPSARRRTASRTRPSSPPSSPPARRRRRTARTRRGRSTPRTS